MVETTSASEATHRVRRHRSQAILVSVSLPDADRPESLTRAVKRSFHRLLSQKKTVPDLFYELVNRLSKSFSLDRASLVVRDQGTGRLSLRSLWARGVLHEGLIVHLPTRGSLLHSAMNNSRCASHALDPGFAGTAFEHKLLVSPRTMSLITCPIVVAGVAYGLVSLASSMVDAFDLITEGHFNPVFEDLGRVLADRLTDNEWQLPSTDKIAV